MYYIQILAILIVSRITNSHENTVSLALLQRCTFSVHIHENYFCIHAQMDQHLYLVYYIKSYLFAGEGKVCYKFEPSIV